MNISNQNDLKAGFTDKQVMRISNYLKLLQTCPDPCHIYDTVNPSFIIFLILQ